MIRTDGIKLLGSPISTEEFAVSQIKSKFDSWTADLDLLCDIAESQPQATYAAFVHGVHGRWAYFLRSCSILVDHLNCLEWKIRYKFITTLSGRSSINDLERDWLGLPNCFGVLGPIYPTQYSSSQYQASLAITQLLVDCLLNRKKELSFEVM